MAASNNISLNVGNSGLSYAIDAELDKELGKDVTLNYDEWTSVFDLIKANQVKENKSQFTDKDTDVRNGKQYVVQANENYEIKQTVWNKIVDIAKKKIGITDTTVKQPEVETVQPQTEDNKTDNKTAKENVTAILKSAGIDLNAEDEQLQNDVISKYSTMLTVAEQNGQKLSDEAIQTRLENYIKGWKYHNFEKQSIANANGNENYTGHQNVDENGNVKAFSSTEEMREAYKQFGKEYVEKMDQNCDGNIDVHEMFYQNLLDYYQKNKNITPARAKKLALQTIEKYKDYNVDNIPKKGDEVYNTQECEIFTETLLKIGLLDENKDTLLSTDEAGAYLMSVAKLEDGNNGISTKEVVNANMGILTSDMSLNEIMKTYNVDEKGAKALQSHSTELKNNLTLYQEFIRTGKVSE